MPTIQIADKPTLDTVASNVSSVKSSIENANYGLSAIKTAIDNSGGGSSLTFPRIISSSNFSYPYSNTSVTVYTTTEKCFFSLFIFPYGSNSWKYPISIGGSNRGTINGGATEVTFTLIDDNSSRSWWSSHYYKKDMYSITWILESNKSVIVTGNGGGTINAQGAYCAYTYEPAQ